MLEENNMNNDALAIKFTDEKYCSRQEVARALGTNLIDTFWSNIKRYRSQYAQSLSLYDISKNNYFVTLTSSLNDKSVILSNKIGRVFLKMNELEKDSYERKQVIFEMTKKSLNYVSKKLGILVNDLALENIIKDINNNSLYEPIQNYYRALKFIEANFSMPIDIDLLANFLEILNGSGELISFFRTKELSSSSQRVLINREYNGAPTALIENMMDNLMEFINKGSVNIVIKLAAVSYMFNYIKPFEAHNEEIAILLMKAILAKGGLENYAIYVPIENTLVENSNELNDYRKETQRSNDLTYYVNAFIPCLDEATSSVLDKIVQISRDLAEKAYFNDEGKTIEESLIEEKHKQEEIIEKNIDEESVKVVNGNKTKEKTNKLEETNNNPAIDLSSFKDFDEKALNKAAENLLESDPNLRPAQAHFFVRHCTMGKYYTIQQFKKAEKCVYETARTSMDNLARRGYYRREQIKNKFVYTPISK